MAETLFPPLKLRLVESLEAVFSQGYFADQVLERTFKTQRKWGARDRRAFAKVFYDIIRWVRPLTASQGVLWEEAWEPVNERIWSFSGLKHLAAKDWENLLGAWLQDFASEAQWVDRFSAEADPVHYSLTDFLYELFKKETQLDLTRELSKLNEIAPVYLRRNPAKMESLDFIRRMEEEGHSVVKVQSVEGAYRLKERKALARSKAFQEGLFEIQDGGSQKIAPFLEVSPGQRVIDACAGAGGKTLHLSSLMDNKGKILALDVHAQKLEELKSRARRAGASNIEVRTIDSSKVIKRLADSADRLLLDVPCSGSGVLRRNPDSKWRFGPWEREVLLREQQSILEDYSSMLKSGGKLVYSTCSLFQSENEDQVAVFLKSSSGQSFELEEELRVLPAETDFDGFYMARLKKR